MLFRSTGYAVLVPETEESTALSAIEQVQAPQTDSISSNTGEIEINPTSTEARENAPLITLPQELSGNDGQALQDIALRNVLPHYSPLLCCNHTSYRPLRSWQGILVFPC